MIKIREIIESDKKKLLELIESLWADLVKKDPWQDRVLKHEYAQDEYLFIQSEIEKFEGRIYVAEENEKLIGFVTGSIHNSDQRQNLRTTPFRRGKVMDLFVSEEYRGQGLGAKLLETIENYFKEMNCDSIVINVFGPNKDARKFYERHGYEDLSVDVLKKI